MNNIYPNLSAEMARSQPRITKQLIAAETKIPYSTLCEKLSKKGRLSLDEAALIKDEFFPNLTIDYLFQAV